MPSFSSIKILFLGREIVLIYKGLHFQKVGYSQNTCDRMIHGRFVFERIEHHWRVCMDRDDHTERLCIVLALRIVTGPLLNHLLVPICSFMFAFFIGLFCLFSCVIHLLGNCSEVILIHRSIRGRSAECLHTQR